jgi:sporulation protein YlmC with PRC-barrel domain
MKQSTRFISANRLKQYDVINKIGQDMGQVQSFVIDMVAGRIAFVVVSFEGFLGISDKWFAMPWAVRRE